MPDDIARMFQTSESLMELVSARFRLLAVETIVQFLAFKDRELSRTSKLSTY